MKRLKAKFGATVNDVLMALVAGAFGRVIETSSGRRVPRVRISVTVNMRDPGAPLWTR